MIDVVVREDETVELLEIAPEETTDEAEEEFLSSLTLSASFFEQPDKALTAKIIEIIATIIFVFIIKPPNIKFYFL